MAKAVEELGRAKETLEPLTCQVLSSQLMDANLTHQPAMAGKVSLSIDDIR